MRSGLLTACVIALFAGVLSAQEALRGPDGGTSYRVSGVDLLSIPNKPFSAKTRTDWTRTLEDGSMVKLHIEARLARDSQGRTYRERVSFVPEGSTQQSQVNEIMLSDPRTRARTTCVLAARHCNITTYIPRMAFALRPEGAFDNGTRYLARESLGTDVIEGMNVTGSRETVTINAGAIGNERAIVTIREFWYSPDIETNVTTIRKDPREGTQSIHLSEISRSEPENTWFQVPEGFTVQDDRVSGKLRPLQACPGCIQ